MKIQEAPKQNPMWLRFMNREIAPTDLLNSFSKSLDSITAEAASKALEDPQDLEPFRKELIDAVEDMVTTGIGEEFKAFVNHYMGALEETVETENTPRGQNKSHIAKIKSPSDPWIQGFICYNLCLYVKAFGLDNVKKCKVCGKIFAHKGQYATYCSDSCKAAGKLHRTKDSKAD